MVEILPYSKVTIDEIVNVLTNTLERVGKDGPIIELFKSIEVLASYQPELGNKLLDYTP